MFWGSQVGPCQGLRRALYNDVQCVMVQCITWESHHPPPPREQTDKTENITFLKFRWRVVTMKKLYQGGFKLVCQHAISVNNIRNFCIIFPSIELHWKNVCLKIY